MDYTWEDIVRYLETFAGECVLYYLLDNQLKLAGFTEHVPALFGMTAEEYKKIREADTLGGVLENDRKKMERALEQTGGTTGTADLHIRENHTEKGYLWYHIKIKNIGKYQKNRLIAVAYQEEQAETEVMKGLLNEKESIVYLCDADNFELLYANAAALSRIGKTNYHGHTCYEFIKGLDKPCFHCSNCQMRDRQDGIQEQYDKNAGRWYRKECRLMEFYGRKAYLFSIDDITEEKQRRMQLQEDNTLIERITRVVFEFIALIDINNRTIQFRDINEKLENVAPTKTEKYDEDILYAIEMMVIPKEQEYCLRCASIENLVAQLEKMELYSYTWTQPERNGKNSRKMLEFCWFNDRHDKIIAMKSDITKTYQEEQRQMEQLRMATEEARKASSAKSDFLSRISHDMRTPLNGIIGLTRLMRNETDVNKMKEKLEQMELSGDYLLHLINDTLDVGKIESGKMELRPVVCDGRKFFESTLALVRPNLEEKEISLEVHAQGLPFTMLYLDVGRLEQLSMNILGNAIKFTPRGGKIDFYIENLSSHNGILRDRVTVRDTGIGISSEFLPHIFEPFSQEHGASTSQYQGTGLGMTIAKQIVELMGGEISIQSEPGKGTEVTFTLDLPVATQEQINKSRSRAVVSEIGNSLVGRRVLLCEDNPLNAEIASLLLTEAGCISVHAENGKQGVALFQDRPEQFDVILMDIRMPVMDGLEAAKAIRSIDSDKARNIPIIALTANAYEEDVQKCLEAGMNAHIAKPLEPERMYRVMAKYLRSER